MLSLPTIVRLEVVVQLITVEIKDVHALSNDNCALGRCRTTHDSRNKIYVCFLPTMCAWKLSWRARRQYSQQQVPVRKQEINDAFHPDINDDARGVNAINASCSLFFRLLYRTGTRNSTVHRAFTVHSARMSLYFARSLTAAPTNHNIRTHTSDHSDTHALRI